ncbi:MAG TPA: HAD family hydrolase, partial [Pyrinomonadaceae bacterium]|nr:HAD family hydrolase [Pyrinomonadaceae bacterium]
MKRPAIFLDRDGTLVEEVNYLHRPEDMRVFPFTATALNVLKEAGFLLIVVTNQSGIGRNIYTVEDMNSVHAAFQAEIEGVIDGFYYCPHLPCDGCACRKPALKMIEDAVNDLKIDLENSWMVGDKKIDMEAGQNAGVKTALVLTGYGSSHQATLERLPDVVADDLGAAAQKIVVLHA